MKTIKREHVVIDADGKAIGRIATQVVGLLQGKHKAAYEQHNDHGDSVEIRNAAKVKISGVNKLAQKKLFNYSGYPGGMRIRQLKAVMDKNPAEALQTAIKSMLPKNRLRKDRMNRLKIHND